MKNIFIAMVGTVTLIGSAIAMAGGPDDMSSPAAAPASVEATPSPNALPDSLYIGTDLGYADTPGELASIPGTSKVNDGFAFAFHAGYKFNPYIGLEAGYMRLPKLGYNQAGSFLGNTNNNVYSLMVKGNYHPEWGWWGWDRLDLFAKAGYAVITSDPTVTEGGYTLSGSASTFYNPVVAAGLEYRVLPHLGVDAQYMAIIRVDHQYDTTHLVTAGLNYYF